MTDTHILIAMNNCGSSYGWVLLLDTCGGELMTKTRHAPVRAVKPAWREGRRIIGLQRNPFAWYVGGWYKDHCLQKARGERPVAFVDWFREVNYRPWRHLPAAYRPDEPAYIRPGAYTFFHLHYYLWNAIDVFDTCRTMAEVEAVYDDNLGVDDWVYAHTYYEDFACILGRPLVLDKTRGRNDHSHGPHQDYYTADLRRYVEQNDAFLLDRYGYSWEGPAYRSAEHRYPECPSAIAGAKQ